MNRLASRAWALMAVSFAFVSGARAEVPTTITILHTNDLHSHFRGEKTALGLGGVARIKSAVDEVLAKSPNTLLVDGGDWSEGNIYYTEGAGRETLRLMDTIGYDVAVVGNHDWINGPDTLLDAIDSAAPRMTLVGANFNVDQYARAAEFHRHILPYVIKEVNGVKVAFIGLGTYEIIYDKFFTPVKITEPFDLTHDLAENLKKQADVVVVISHNSIAMNEKILKAAPDVDLIIGAHDHVQLRKPIVVSHSGKAAWIVETGCWGRYLGRVDIQVTPRAADRPSSVNLLNYRLLQMDQKVAENAQILAIVEHLETLIASRMGPVFTDKIAKTDIELGRDGMESAMGDFTADAYRAATGADIAIDERSFIYGELHLGILNSADVFNSNPALWNPATSKSWTLKMLPMKGRLLKWVLNIFLGMKKLAMSQTLVFSGLKAVFSPDLFESPADPGPSVGLSVPPDLLLGLGPVKDIEINGEELDETRIYNVAIGGGVNEAIESMNSVVPNLIPVKNMTDTGKESWRVMADYARQISPISPDHLTVGNRLVTAQPDLGVLYDDVEWTPILRTRDGMRAQVRVTIRNYGNAASKAGAVVELLSNRNGSDLAVEPNFASLAQAQPIPAIAPGGAQSFNWEVVLPEDRDLYSVTAKILGSEGEVNTTNDQITHWFN